MTPSSLKTLIKEGVRNDVVVFDCNAEVETLTKRLFFLMKWQAKRQGEKLIKIFIPCDVYPDFTTSELYDGWQLQPFFWGVALEACSLLDGGKSSLAVKEYLSHEGTVMCRDQQSLVIGISNHFNYALLGATNGEFRWMR